MSPAQTLLATLVAGGATVWVENDRVRYRGSPMLFTAEVIAEMRRLKTELLSTLTEAGVGVGRREAAQFVFHIRKLAALGADLTVLDHFFERAAILEFESQHARDDAELAAAEEALGAAAAREAGQ